MPQGIYQELLYDELAKIIGVARDGLEQIDAPKPAFKPQEPPPQPFPTTQAPSKLILHCICLLLQEPSLAKSVTDTAFLQDKSDRLFLKLLHIFKEHPELPVGQLLTHWDDPSEQALIAKLAAKELIFPKENYSDEFLDTLNKIKQQNRRNTINQLIQKAKATALSADEKTQLTTLLAEQ